MNEGLNTTGLEGLQEATKNLGRIIFGIFAGLTALLLVGMIILASLQNAKEDDPQKRKQNRSKILWAFLAMIFIVVGWGIYELVLSMQAKNLGGGANTKELLKVFTVTAPTIQTNWAY